MISYSHLEILVRSVLYLKYKRLQKHLKCPQNEEGNSMATKRFHLVCNAHLDPVWLWEWEEGAAEALSTFRTAADLCEEFGDFIFCHNEVILYKWVEEYEPALFARIQKLVKAKKWHIMGGWFLQPDCNMPSGESFVRQMLAGRQYFKKKFGVVPTTAINFDPFGHTRGLVQIMAKAGFDSYIICRPPMEACGMPDRTFRWVGLDGSSVIVNLAKEAYLSGLGKARGKAEGCITAMKDRPGADLILWGVGNHGGGPSRKDIRDLNALRAERDDVEIVHSTPERFFADVTKTKGTLPVCDVSLNPCMVGCYTSQVRIKQQHRALENELYMTEKMASAAALRGVMPYPGDDFAAAQYDLLMSEFHDILPGSSIQAVEDMALRVMAHGREILSRVRARAFFSLASGQKKAAPGTIPVLVYNPHPWPVDAVVEVEFQLADQNWADTFTDIRVTRAGRGIASQIEKERSNLTLDWRKRLVFHARLDASSMNRFDCMPVVIPEKPMPKLAAKNGRLTVTGSEVMLSVNTRTGLVDRLRIGGRDMVKAGAFGAVVLADTEDAWKMQANRLGDVCGRFRLMSAKRGTEASGVTAGVIPSVRVIEDGAVRTVIEAVFEYGTSSICQRYMVPKTGTAFEMETRVVWAEKDKALKLEIPAAFGADEYLGQIAYGTEALRTDGTEVAAQKWVALVGRKNDRALSCIMDGGYGSDFEKGTARLTLMRSAAYSGHPIGKRPIVRQDGFTERIDQGERVFRFRLGGGAVKACLKGLDRTALAAAEKPMALSFFPSGAGTVAKPLVECDGAEVTMTAFKRAEDGRGWIIRLHEPSGRVVTVTVKLPLLGIRKKLVFGPFEIKTLRIGRTGGKMAECGLMEWD